ncbi:MAG: TetR/AcrR family transcriptional regulator [Clostridium sp.]|jgi:TetR/AcrR family fatty acid metabolism transcriptional regulator
MYTKNNKRTQQAKKTRERIFSAAAELLNQKPFDSITIAEITSKAEISTGAFYHHFQSKDELFFEWVNQLDEIYQNFFDEEVSHVTPENVLELIRQKINLVLETYSKWGAEIITTSYTFMMKNEKLRGRMTNNGRICNLIAYELFSKGQNWGIIRADVSITDLISSHIKTERGALIDWCIQGGCTDILKENEALIQLHIDSLRVRPESTP